MAAGLQPFRNSIVRIGSLKGEFVGLGYRLNDELVLTCAHVVAEALGTEAANQDAPDGTLRIDHPFGASKTEDGPPSHEASVEPGGWYSKDIEHGPSDLALLRLHQPTPAPPPLAALSGALSLAGTRFTSYGGISGHEETLAPIHGTVRDPIAGGRWQVGTETEYTIEPGCSGGPAADRETGEVLGLIVQDEQDPSIPAGFLIGAREIRQALERVGVAIRAPDRGLPEVRAWAKNRIPSPAYDEQQSVLRFIDYYAGRPDRPMPFAGRDEELTRLDAWWAAESGSFLLVSGPAGIGKSALLLHWLAGMLDTREATGVLFLPVSIRFGTSDELSGLRLLHAQLAGLFAELRFPSEAKPDPTDYRAKIQEGWRLIASRAAERYLLVVDGADESAGPWLREGVLPYEVPENLAIALSARHKPGHQDGGAWLEDFTFGPSVPITEPLELEPLARDAVGEAMVQLGHPVDELVDLEGVLDELYRLTDRGDPLLVSLWAAQLWGERGRVPQLSAEDLAALEPSFAGFLDQWMEEQERLWERDRIEVHPDDLDRLLGVLGCAHGPVRLSDLLEVEARLQAPTPWDYKSARRVLDQAGRLVVGDPERTGYTFVHPRLADEFRRRAERLGLKDRSIHRAFAEWGWDVVATLNSGALEPTCCPRYLLRHYTTHVLETELSNDEVLERLLLPLLGWAWHRAWYADEGAYSGYLADLERVETLLEKVNRTAEMPVPRLGELIRCVLIRSRITSLTSQLPAELVVALIRSGLWTVERGLRVASSFRDRRTTTVLEGLSADAGGLLKGDNLERALSAAEGIGEDRYRARALSAVADQLEGEARQKVLERALAAAQGVRLEWCRAEALLAVASQLGGEARREALERVLSAAEGIEVEGTRATALSRAADQLGGDSALLERALSAAQGIKNELCRATALSAVAGQLEGEARREILERALSAAEGIGNKTDRAQVLSAVAGKLKGEVRRDVLKRALSAAEGIGNEIYRAPALLAVARQLEGQAQWEVLEGALAAAEGIGDKRRRALALSAVARQLEGQARQEALERALSAAEGIGYKGDQLKALSVVAARAEGETALLERALSVAEGIGDQRFRVRALSELATQLDGEVRRDVLKRALSAAEEIGDEGSRVRALSELATQVDGEARRDVLKRALSTAEGIAYEPFRAKTLSEVASQLAGEPALLERAQSAAEEIGDEGSRVRALVAVAEQLGGEAALLERAQSAAEGIGDEKRRARALTAVASQLEREARRYALKRALSAAEGIVTESIRAKALLEVSTHLDGEARRYALKRALSAAEGIGPERVRARVLSEVAGELGGEAALLERALSAAEGIVNESIRAEALLEVSTQLDGAARRDVLKRALSTAEGIAYEPFRGKTLSEVASQLAGEAALLERALSVAEEIGDEGLRVRALVAVAGRLRGEAALLERALSAAERIGNEGRRTEALSAVAGELGGEAALLEHALSAAEGIGNEEDRAKALLAVASQLKGEARWKVLERALSAAERIGNEDDRAQVLLAVVRGAGCKEALLRRAFEASITPSFTGTTLVACAAEIVAQLPVEFGSLCRVLRAMGALRRGDSVLLSSRFADRIREVGGVEAVHGTVQGIVDTAEYWP